MLPPAGASIGADAGSGDGVEAVDCTSAILSSDDGEGADVGVSEELGMGISAITRALLGSIAGPMSLDAGSSV